MGLFYHLSAEEKEFAKKKSLFCLIIYDITSNKRRLKLAKLLEGFGVRVQRSCFEVDLEVSSYQLLLVALQDFYDAKQEDNIIIYVGSREETIRLNENEGSVEREDCLFFQLKALGKYGILRIVSREELSCVLFPFWDTRYGGRNPPNPREGTETKYSFLKRKVLHLQEPTHTSRRDGNISLILFRTFVFRQETTHTSRGAGNSECCDCCDCC